MPAIVNCTTGTLAPYVPSVSKPWNLLRAHHLYRRLQFGAPPETLDAALKRSPAELVDDMIGQAANLALPVAPAWANWTIAQYSNFPQQAFEQGLGWVENWIRDMMRYGLREKLALFWHNHFVTRAETYGCPSYLFQYHRLLQKHALGNFKTFVKEIGVTPAMLIFLNGVQNNRFQPNENYARELYELFTLGRDNGYTQQDIKETARALTGWVGFTTACAPIGFVQTFFDSGNKTIFGKTANWNYDTLHDLLFAERGEQIARYICTKIYKAFVHPEPDEQIIAGMAATFRNNNFELAPVLRQLFKSEHFFDDYIIGAQIKSPLDMILGFLKDGHFPYDNSETLRGIYYLAGVAGQRLFDPPDVAGWPGNRSWIDSNTLTGRWETLDIYLYQLYSQYGSLLRDLAKKLQARQNDPAAITRALAEHFLVKGLEGNGAYDRATAVFKHEVPQNYYDNGQWNLDWEIASGQVALLIRYLYQQPEFQLT